MNISLHMSLDADQLLLELIVYYLTYCVLKFAHFIIYVAKSVNSAGQQHTNINNHPVLV